MLRVCCKIEITRSWIQESGADALTVWNIDRVANVSITGDSDTLADTCRIELPRNAKWVGSGNVPIRRGDDVVVWLGYNEKLDKRFVGKVKEVSAGTPTVITCEDMMFVLRQKSIKKKLYTKCEVGALLKDILPAGIKYETSGKIEIGDYRTTATTVAGELALLYDNCHIKSFFELNEKGAPVLYVYSIFAKERNVSGTFATSKNVISHNLEYKRADDVRIRVKGVSTFLNGKKIEYSEGDGDERTINYYNLNMAQLKVAVKNELKRLKWDGLNGTFETFGKPVVRKMDVLDLEIEGVTPARYQVKAVNVDFGQNGYRQKIELQRKVLNNE